MQADTALTSMTDEGWVPDEVLKDEVTTRGELIKATTSPDPEKLYDYSIIKKSMGSLKTAGSRSPSQRESFWGFA